MNITAPHDSRSADRMHPIARMLAREFLRFDIDSAERWVRECERDGILESDTLTRIRSEIAAKRVRLARLERPSRPYIAAGLDQQGRRPDRVPEPAADSAEGACGDDLRGFRTSEAERVTRLIVGGVAVGGLALLTVRAGAWISRLFLS